MSAHLSSLGMRAIHGADGDPARAIALAEPFSPYLSRIVRRMPDALERLAQGPEAGLEAALVDIRHAGSVAGPLAEPMRILRRAKDAAHLAIAGADLAGVWPLDRVVESITQLADATVDAALRLSIRNAWANGSLGEKKETDELPGLFTLAMGK